MTSEAPKEIFVGFDGRDYHPVFLTEAAAKEHGWNDIDCAPGEEAISYTLTTHALAMVAAEREACAETCDCRDREKPDSLYILGAIDANQAAARRILAALEPAPVTPAQAARVLLAMADLIGVDRKWIQKAGRHDEHFDIAMSKRRIAVEAGAIEVSMKDLGRILRARRPTPGD